MALFGKKARRPRPGPLEREAALRAMISIDATESAAQANEERRRAFIDAVGRRDVDAAVKAANDYGFGVATARAAERDGWFRTRPAGMTKEEHDAAQVDAARRRHEAGAPALDDVRSATADGDLDAAIAALERFTEAVSAI